MFVPQCVENTKQYKGSKKAADLLVLSRLSGSKLLTVGRRERIEKRKASLHAPTTPAFVGNSVMPV